MRRTCQPFQPSQPRNAAEARHAPRRHPEGWRSPWTRVVSDKAGLPLAITDPLGATTRYERDAFGRAVSITDPLGAVTRLEWTVEGKLARRVEADGSEQSWTYDGEGNCVARVDVLGGAAAFCRPHTEGSYPPPTVARRPVLAGGGQENGGRRRVGAVGLPYRRGVEQLGSSLGS